MIQVSTISNIRLMYKKVPERLKDPLQRALRETERFGSVTNLFVNPKEIGNGQIAADMTRVGAEDILERHV